MTQLGLIGRGAWSRNITRTLDEMGVTWVAHPRPGDAVDAVIIANKSRDHVSAALPFLRAGTPCFIEKPVALSLAAFDQLDAAMNASAAFVFVGHLHLFNPACQVFLATLPEIGTLRRAKGRFANNKPREDVSVIWDWLPHPLSIAARMFGAPPSAANARATARPERPSTVDAAVFFGDHRFDLWASWEAPAPQMTITVTGDLGRLTFDDRAEQKVTLHQNGQTRYPAYAATPPLRAELRAFVDTIHGRCANPAPLADARPVLQTLAALEASCRQGGTPVVIAPPTRP